MIFYCQSLPISEAAWTAARTRSATAAGVELSSLPSRCRNAKPCTRAQIAVNKAPASLPTSGKARRTRASTYAEMAAVAEQSSAASQQVSASAEQTTASTVEIAGAAEGLARAAAGLDELVQQFGRA